MMHSNTIALQDTTFVKLILLCCCIGSHYIKCSCNLHHHTSGPFNPTMNSSLTKRWRCFLKIVHQVFHLNFTQNFILCFYIWTVLGGNNSYKVHAHQKVLLTGVWTQNSWLWKTKTKDHTHTVDHFSPQTFIEKNVFTSFTSSFTWWRSEYRDVVNKVNTSDWHCAGFFVFPHKLSWETFESYSSSFNRRMHDIPKLHCTTA